MKTVITSAGDRVSSAFDQRFGRAAWFCLLDEETGQTRFLQNEFAEASQGAGRKVVEKVAGLGVNKVISGDFGPKTRELLEHLNIQMVMINDDAVTVADIIKKIK
ncbi:MAG: NifB/NifX family molybdenum-iron cluster-binding protein [Bacteroidales bacterium]